MPDENENVNAINRRFSRDIWPLIFRRAGIRHHVRKLIEITRIRHRVNNGQRHAVHRHRIIIAFRGIAQAW